MTKALTAPTTLAAGRKWAKPVYLAKLELTSPSAKTLRFGNGALRKDNHVAAGQEWPPYVLSWGNLEEVMSTMDAGGSPATAEITFRNNRPIEGKARLSSLIRTEGNAGAGTYEFTFAKFTVYQLFRGLGSADLVTVGVFYLEDNPRIDDRVITFRMIDASQVIEDQMLIRQLTNDAFPLADPDDVGRDIPIAIGTLKNVPCLAAVAGWRSASSTAITATSPGVGAWLTVSDDRAPTSGVGQCDDEQFRWDSKRISAGLPQVRIAARGINGTTATAHAAGAGLFQVLSGTRAYGYIVCENVGAYKLASGSVTNVRVNDVLQTAVTIDYDNTTLVPGRSFVVVWFSALPILKRQVNLGVRDELAVTDNIAVSSPSLTTVRLAPDTGDALGQKAIGNGTNSQPLWRTVTAFVNFPDPPGTVTSVLYSGSVQIIGIGASDFSLSVNGRRIAGSGADDNINSGSPSGSHAFQYGGSGAVRAVNVELGYRAQYAQSGTIQILAIADASGAIQINKTGGATRTPASANPIRLEGNSTADVVIGGQVTCDITNGIRDDASGTITGTPSASIRYPADVIKFSLLALFAVPAADIGNVTTARTTHTNGNYVWDFLLGKHLFSELRRKFGEQSRSVLHLEGGLWQLKLLTTATSASSGVTTLTHPRDFWDGVKLTVSRTPATEIRNRVTVYAGRDYRKSGTLAEQYTIVRVLGADADKLAYDLELDFIQSVTLATRIGNFWRDVWKRQRLMVEGAAWWNALAFEKYDLVAIANHGVLTDLAPAGAYRIIEKRYLLADRNPARIRFKAIEANP